MKQYPRIGIMQGRLSPPIHDQVQTFPISGWREEFRTCEELGLGCMEWVFDYPTARGNPIFTEEGTIELAKVVGNHRVRINSVVADYFMVKKLFGKQNRDVEVTLSVLEDLIKHCARAKIPLIELPFVDDSSLESEEDCKSVVDNLLPLIKRNQRYNVRFSFETSLEPKLFRKFIDAFKPLNVFANYDMGNSAALGYDAREEIRLLGNSIVNVHVKDRAYKGVTVPLGEGDTDFPVVFSELQNIGYLGDYILQAARQDLTSDYREADYKKTIGSYIEFVAHYVGI